MFLVNTNIAQDCDSFFFHERETRELTPLTAKEIYDPSLPRISILNTWEDHEIEKTDTFSILDKKENIGKWIHLYQSFEKAFKEKNNLFFNIPFEKISSDFKISLYQILALYPNVISVGVSNDECVFIYFESGNKSVFFDLFFDQESLTEVLLNISENKKSICSYSDTMDNALLKLKEFIQVPEYELSGSLIACY